MESTMDNLLLHSMIEATGAQIAFSNGWRYGAHIIPGPVTNNDLYNIIPGNPEIGLVEISGEELLEMLEENLEKTFSGDAYKQQGGFVKRCIGLKALIKIEAPQGNRIQQLFVGDEPVNLQRNYSACFVTSQGVPKIYGNNRSKTNVKAVDAMRQYFEKHSPVKIETLGTYTAI